MEPIDHGADLLFLSRGVQNSSRLASVYTVLYKHSVCGTAKQYSWVERASEEQCV